LDVELEVCERFHSLAIFAVTIDYQYFHTSYTINIKQSDIK